jgi:hypothetical protein
MLSKSEFVRRVLDGAASSPRGAANGGSMVEGFAGFAESHSADERDGRSDLGRFAQVLLEESGFGRGETVLRQELVLGEQTTSQFLPDAAIYWPKTAEQPFYIVLFDLEQKGSDIVDNPFFRQHDQLEDALHRFVQDALEGFERGGEARTADRKRGAQTETLCVISVVDDRRDGPARQLVCFGTKCTATNALEVFTLREEARDWDRPLAEEHLGQLFERHFKRLATGARWQDAFISGKERKQARRLLDECARLIPDEKQLRVAIGDLLDEIAGSFGLRPKSGKGGRRLVMHALPDDHSIAVDPAEARKKGFKNPLHGLRIFDIEERLLGYIVYVLDKKSKAEQLRSQLEIHNHFHNVLVIYPDEAAATLELWQGKKLLRGRLTTGARRSRFDGDGGVVQLLSRFFVVSKSEIATPEHLAKELAWRALHIRVLAFEEVGPAGQLAGLYQSFNDSLTYATSAEFADAYAQTITYGLLAARWLSRDLGTRFTRKAAASQLPKSSPFLRELFTHLLNIGTDANLTWLLDDLTSLLSRTKVNDVFADEQDPSIHFFQDFLSEYDNDTRRSKGVYYTPQEVVDYMVSLVDCTLQSLTPPRRLGGDGVRTVDPATGTGTFLKTTVLRWAKAADKQAIQPCFDQIRGMEVMVAPYAICHLRLSLLRRELLGEELDSEPISVVLCNALSLPATPSPELFGRTPALAHEAELANQLKQERAYTVVIGNPPYQNNSPLTLAQVAERFPALLQASRAAAGAGKRNIRDDYAWFFCLADSLLAGGGIICFITSDSYLRKASYRYFREAILERYKIHQITRLGPNIFRHVGPRIGFAIIAMELRDEPLDQASDSDAFRYVDISRAAEPVAVKELGTPSDPRLRWLASHAKGEHSEVPVEHALVRAAESNEFRFIPESKTEVGLRCQIISKRHSPNQPIFLKKWPGIITAFDVLLKADQKRQLVEKMKRFFSVAASGDAAEIAQFAGEIGCTGKANERLIFLCEQATRKQLRFDKRCIKPTFAGSIPHGHEWYPPAPYSHWIYFEPKIQIPRNVNPGKDAGWGWMQQWRPTVTHETYPKLIFTTSTNTQYGYRGYVVDGGWYTKLDGAASQKYHYVSLEDPTKPSAVHGGPNNLSTSGMAALAHIENAGLQSEDMLHILACVYNSKFAMTYMQREKDHMLPLPDISVAPAAGLRRLAQLARDLRCYWQAKQPPTTEPFPVLTDCKQIRSDVDPLIAEAQRELDSIVNKLVGG